jgi:uncharacterized protein YjbI with pentapeptide repeats
MVSELTNMKGEEFVTKILSGERDFRNIRLEEGFDLTGHARYREVYKYLMKEAAMEPCSDMPGYVSRSSNLPLCLKESPIDISNSELRYFKAGGLYLSWTKGINTDLSYSNLSGIYLDEAKIHVRFTELEDSDFRNANFYKANIDHTNLNGINFSGANLESAKMPSAFCETIFDNANLRNIIFNMSKLEKTSLKGADVRGAEFVGTLFDRADIRGIKYLRRSIGLDEAVFYMTHATQKEVDLIRNASRRFVLHDK